MYAISLLASDSRGFGPKAQSAAALAQANSCLFLRALPPAHPGVFGAFGSWSGSPAAWEGQGCSGGTLSGITEDC